MAALGTIKFACPDCGRRIGLPVTVRNDPVEHGVCRVTLTYSYSSGDLATAVGAHARAYHLNDRRWG